MQDKVVLRALRMSDAEGMLEWMHDGKIASYFRTDMMERTIEDVHEFISNANENKDSLHYAICIDDGEYLGTISLKNIDLLNMQAEYAIVLRKGAQGKGIAYQATKQILDIAFKELNLQRVYLNVLADNKRAISTYTKCGFVFEGTFRQAIRILGKFRDLSWYSILKDDYIVRG